MDIPTCDTVSSTHLNSAVIDACLRKEHKPVNPHSQRLLTAEARAVSKLPEAKAKAKGKATAKAKAHPKDKPKRKSSGKEKEEQEEEEEELEEVHEDEDLGDGEDIKPPPAKKSKTKKEDLKKQKESGVMRTEYSSAKLEFFDRPELLGSRFWFAPISCVLYH